MLLKTKPQNLSKAALFPHEDIIVTFKLLLDRHVNMQGVEV